MLGFGIARVENEAWWGDVLSDLVARGLSRVRLVVSDAHQGLKRATAARLPAARWQRCKVHVLRKLGGRRPKRHRAALLSRTKTVFEQQSLEEACRHRALVARCFREAKQADPARFLEQADEVLTHREFPRAHWSKLHSTNMVERRNQELKRRTRVVSIFPSRQALARLVGARLLEEHEEWMVSRRTTAERSLDQLKTTEEQLHELAPDAAKLLLPAASR